MNVSRRAQTVKENDIEWEDVGEPEVKSYSRTGSEPASPDSSLKGSPRKKRQGSRTVFIAASPRKPYSISRLKPPLRQPIASGEEMHAVVHHTVRNGAKYTFEVLTTGLSWLKKPLSLFLVLWAIAFIANSLSASLRAAFYPLCILPGISRSMFCTPTYKRPSESVIPQHADYPQMINLQSQTFEQLLDESVGGSGLALEIKKAEMATSDLITLVKVSHLTSRDLLAKSLAEFVEDARKTGRGLQTLSSRVGGAVDNILAVNDYALRSIEAAAPSKSLISYVWPFGKAPSTAVLTSTFEQAMSVLSGSLQRCVLEAEASLHNLDKLEQQLQTIHSLATREDASLAEAKHELLAQLWTKLGGNRKEIRGFNAHLNLLRNVGNYRTRALAHVVAALQTLQAMSTDMEDLRERVAAPELVGGEIPLEVHVKSIRSGLQRLNEGRLRAKEREEEAMNRILGLEE